VGGRPLNEVLGPLERIEAHRKLLIGASEAAEKAFHAIASPGLAHVPIELREAWLTATVIHCDLCRLMVAYEECERDGIARLLWMGDIASKLYEARLWFHQIGNKLLLKLAHRHGDDQAELRSRLKELERAHPIKNAAAYEKYRHKVGHHYSPEIGTILHDFGQSDSDVFFGTIADVTNYARNWVAMYKHLVRDIGPEPSSDSASILSGGA